MDAFLVAILLYVLVTLASRLARPPVGRPRAGPAGRPPQELPEWPPPGLPPRPAAPRTAARPRRPAVPRQLPVPEPPPAAVEGVPDWVAQPSSDEPRPAEVPVELGWLGRADQNTVARAIAWAEILGPPRARNPYRAPLGRGARAG